MGILSSVIFSLSLSSQVTMAQNLTQVPGFSAELAPALANNSASTRPQLLRVSLEQFNRKLIWNFWIERIDGTEYPGVMNGIPTDSLMVFFKLSPDRKFVHLFEMNSVKGDVRGEKLIDRFPVIEISNKSVVFDFASGLKKRSFKDIFNLKTTYKFEIQYSYVDDFENYQNSVTFTEVLKLNDQKLSTAILHHSFRVPDTASKFLPIKVLDPMGVGFIVANFAELEVKDRPVTIRRFDPSKPVTFSISSNTPEYAINAIKEGLLWWNEAFGFEYIKVKVLATPVKWASARINIVQWSEDSTLCAPASAIGPTEANPETGEIYLGKILLCMGSFDELYQGSIDKQSVSVEEFGEAAIKWTAAHELGHVLGFSHNFKGKHFQKRERLDEKIKNSTVMDYPYPLELLDYKGVEARDLAMIKFSYLDGGEEALNSVKAIPYCSDYDTLTDPDCNQFVRGGLDSRALAQRYVEMMVSGETLFRMEHLVRKVVLKRVFSVNDGVSVDLARKLFTLYPGSKSLLVEDVKLVAAALTEKFLSLDVKLQKNVLEVLTDLVLDSRIGYSLEDRKNLVEIIASFKDLSGYLALGNISFRLREGDHNVGEWREFMIIRNLVEEKQKSFWD